MIFPPCLLALFRPVAQLMSVGPFKLPAMSAQVSSCITRGYECDVRMPVILCKLVGSCLVFVQLCMTRATASKRGVWGGYARVVSGGDELLGRKGSLVPREAVKWRKYRTNRPPSIFSSWYR